MFIKLALLIVGPVLFQALSIPGEWAPTCSSAQGRRRTSGAPSRSQASSWRTVQYWWPPAEGSTRSFWWKTTRRADSHIRQIEMGSFRQGAALFHCLSLGMWLNCVISCWAKRSRDLGPFYGRRLFCIAQAFCRSWQRRDYFFKSDFFDVLFELLSIKVISMTGRLNVMFVNVSFCVYIKKLRVPGF